LRLKFPGKDLSPQDGLNLIIERNGLILKHDSFSL
jgi:hypothetical protein